MDFTAKVAFGPAPSFIVTDSSAEKGKYASTGSCERSIEFETGEFPEVCVLLKGDLLEDVDTCAKFVDSVGKIFIRSDSFVKCPT
ncbi:hypothetical protein ACFX13_027783 [Malus domestica]